MHLEKRVTMYSTTIRSELDGRISRSKPHILFTDNTKNAPNVEKIIYKTTKNLSGTNSIPTQR